MRWEVEGSDYYSELLSSRATSFRVTQFTLSELQMRFVTVFFNVASFNWQEVFNHVVEQIFKNWIVWQSQFGNSCCDVVLYTISFPLERVD